jgi:hypothetical protein
MRNNNKFVGRGCSQYEKCFLNVYSTEGNEKTNKHILDNVLDPKLICFGSSFPKRFDFIRIKLKYLAYWLNLVLAISAVSNRPKGRNNYNFEHYSFRIRIQLRIRSNPKNYKIFLNKNCSTF